MQSSKHRRNWHTIGLKLIHCHQRWPRINPTFYQGCFLLAVLQNESKIAWWRFTWTTCIRSNHSYNYGNYIIVFFLIWGQQDQIIDFRSEIFGWIERMVNFRFSTGYFSNKNLLISVARYKLQVVSKYRRNNLTIQQLRLCKWTLSLTMCQYSVTRRGFTRWKQGYIKPPAPYFILWNAVTSLGENKVI